MIRPFHYLRPSNLYVTYNRVMVKDPEKTKAGNKSKFYTCHTFCFRVGTDLFATNPAKAFVELYHTTSPCPQPDGAASVSDMSPGRRHGDGVVQTHMAESGKKRMCFR